MFFDLYTKEVASFMYKYKTDMLPSSFDGFFTLHCENHNYNTRNKDDFEIPIHKIKTVFTTGPHIWNNLPNNLKSTKTFGQFKSTLKSYLFAS